MTTYRRAAAVERTLVGGRLLVLGLDQETPTELGGSAPTVWSVLEYTHDLSGILSAVESIYTDDPEVISAGVKEALQQMVDAELVVEQE
jgi:hypothetical protein